MYTFLTAELSRQRRQALTDQATRYRLVHQPGRRRGRRGIGPGGPARADRASPGRMTDAPG